MIAYKANAMKWTHENGFETLDKIIIGKLDKGYKADDIQTIAYEWEDASHSGYGACRFSMVDKNTVEKVECRKVTDEVKNVYWYEEVARD